MQIKYFIKSIVSSICYFIKLALLKRKKTNKKIKVVFYVTENQKWGYQSLYDILLKDKRFDLLVVIGLLHGVHKGKDKTRKNVEENYQFFKSKGMNVEYGYRNNKYINLRTFSPDVVFYEQPWGLPKSHEPHNVSKFALTYYCPYSFQLFKNMQDSYSKFYRFLYKYFLTHELNLKRIENHINKKAKNCEVIGYPKLDVYKQQITDDSCWKKKDKIKIIYAPHHSLEENSLNLATFRENGRLILDWAKSHTETTWIFKPHPRFKFALLSNGVMNEKEVEEYYAEWERIGSVYTQGNYFDIFKTSDLMITDSGSFLAEYLPTKNPLIRPVNSKGIEFNETGSLLTSAFYQTKNNDELLKVLDDVVINKNDYKKDERMKVISEFFDFDEAAASKIYKGMLKDFNLN